MVDYPGSDSTQYFYDKTNIRITTSVTNSLAHSFNNGSSFTYKLGITVEARLSFDTRVSDLCMKYVLQLNMLERLSPFITKEETKC